MLDVLGDEYISQHIYNKRYEELLDISYKSYVTDCLRIIAGVEKRWYSRFENLEKPQKPEPTVNELLAMVKKIK